VKRVAVSRTFDIADHGAHGSGHAEWPGRKTGTGAIPITGKATSYRFTDTA
jgi:hypothetical protein